MLAAAGWSLQYKESQSSVLSLMLFNIHAKLLGEIIFQFTVRQYQHVNDTNLYHLPNRRSDRSYDLVFGDLEGEKQIQTQSKQFWVKAY